MVFDVIEEKDMSAEACRIWLFDNDIILERYLDEHWSFDSKDEILNWILENPKLVVPLLMDEDELESIKIQRILNLFEGKRSTIAIILGARGEGKTATAYWLAEEIHKQKRKIYYCAPSPDLKMPDFMIYCSDPSEASGGSVIILDEAGIQLPARTSATERQVELQKQLQVFRHHDKSVIFITQHTALLDLNLTRLADLVILKPLSLLQEGTERKVYLQYTFYKPKFREMATFIGNNFITQFHIPLPSFWSDKLSKSWDIITDEKMAIEFCNNAIHSGFSLKETQDFIKARGFDRSSTWVSEHLNPANKYLLSQRALRPAKEESEKKKQKQEEVIIKLKPLNPRLQAVYELKKKGYDDYLIAEKRGLTVGSIRQYLHQIKDKGWVY